MVYLLHTPNGFCFRCSLLYNSRPYTGNCENLRIILLMLLQIDLHFWIYVIGNLGFVCAWADSREPFPWWAFPFAVWYCVKFVLIFKDLVCSPCIPFQEL